jgi:hypothetical protein
MAENLSVKLPLGRPRKKWKESFKIDRCEMHLII